jgi:hypothetical protein
MSCPGCGERLALKHRWFYWPAMVFGGTVLCLPLAWLGYRLTDSIVVTMSAATIGWLISGLPTDRWLEDRFAILKSLDNRGTPPKESPAEPKAAVDEEPEKEQV